MIPLRVFPVLLLILQLGSGSARNLLEEQRCPPVLEQLWKMPNATLFADLMLGIITEDPDNCALIPCTRIYKPVCSTLGNPYSNDCLARACGAKIASQGPCPSSDTPDKPGAKSAEDPNNCATKPCPRIFAPVCSTGGNTYDNKCIAESCNAVVAYAGACKPEASGVPARVAIASTEGCQQVMCTTVWEPVCTLDGRTFGNDCQAKACGATVAYAGQCITEGTDPAKSLEGELECEEKACPLNLAPVCSTDGRTFDNECLMGACKQTKACDGPCPCGSTGGGAVGEVPVADICPTIYKPVCDTNGVTQSNDCVAAAAGAQIACEGECPCEGGEVEVPVATACPLIELPVCSTNNATYANDCLAKAAGATVACQGECPCEGAEALEVSPVPCPYNYMPVCGIDGNTYANDCVAVASGTLVACQGECPCPDLLRQLEQEGGLLIVPTDDVLLDQLARSNMTVEEFAQDEQAVKLLLASLLVSPPYELDLTTSGSTSTNQAGQEVMYTDEDGTQVIVNKDALLELGVASITTQCNMTFVEVDTQSPYEA